MTTRRTPQERDLIAADRFPDHMERFWSKVQKTDGCWIWHGSLNKQGYGYFSMKREMFLAHRVAWVAVYGPTINAPMLDHRCHVHACVNPAHTRPCESKGNQENRSGIEAGKSSSAPTGVSWDSSRNKWFASIGHNGRTIALGRYESVDDAARAVHVAKLKYHQFYQPKHDQELQ